MSKHITEKVKCPKCGNEWDHKIYQTINVSMDPELKEKIFNKELFIYNCPNCNNKSILVTPLLYADNNFWIYLWPYEWEKFESNSTIDKLLSNMRIPCRKVKNEDELIEKIRIFDDWLKDEYIEFLKLSMIANHFDSSKVSRILYMGKDDNNLYFTTYLNDWNSQTYSTPIAWYEKFLNSEHFKIPVWEMIEISIFTLLNYLEQDSSVVPDNQFTDEMTKRISDDNMPLIKKLENIISDMRPDDKIHVSKLFEDDNKKYDNFLFHKKESINPEDGKNYTIISVNKEETRYYILRFSWEKLIELFPKAKNKDWTPDKFIRIWFKDGNAYRETWDWNPLDVTPYIFQKSGI